MVIKVQNILDYLKTDEYVYCGDTAQKGNNIQFPVLSYDLSALHSCGRHDALFVIPPQGIPEEDLKEELSGEGISPAALIIFVKEKYLEQAAADEYRNFPVIYIRYHSLHSAKELYRKISSLVRLSGDTDTLYKGIATGLLWNEKKYERNDIVFLCKLLGIITQGPYRVFIAKGEAADRQVLSRIKAHLSSKYDMHLTVVWEDYLVGILAGEETERARLNDLYKAIVEESGHNIKISLSSCKYSLTEIHNCLQEALRTYDLVGVIQHVDTNKTVLCYDELGIYQVLFELNDSKVFNDYCHTVFHSLWDYDSDNGTDLFRTLGSYFRNELDLKRTASELFIHTNTLRYRLNQIENIMGRDLKDLHSIVEIETAFMVRTMSEVIF